ncbi:MAG TPA: CBS domain-containing protein [Methanospirillum sp.]|nr:CBS domain-containing protein [Methanospirillum sp.]
MLVSDLMSSPVYGCQASDTVSYARNMMFKHHISRVLIMEDQRIEGIVTKKDIGYRLRGRDPSWRRRPLDSAALSTVMVSDVVSISPDSNLHDALSLMVMRHISGFPVVDQGMVLGVLTKSDCMHAPLITGYDRPVSGVMRDAVLVTGEHSLDHVIDLIRDKSGIVVVTGDHGEPAGVISESDLAFHEQTSDNAVQIRASDVMKSPVQSLPFTARTGDVVRMMHEKKISSVVITGDQGIKGIITRDDIIREVVQ